MNCLRVEPYWFASVILVYTKKTRANVLESNRKIVVVDLRISLLEVEVVAQLVYGSRPPRFQPVDIALCTETLKLTTNKTWVYFNKYMLFSKFRPINGSFRFKMCF